MRLRRDLPPVFGREPALRQIEALLKGESIRLPEAAVKLGQRTLLSGLETARGVRPEALLARMVDAFAAARDAVLTVSTVWDEVAAAIEAAEAALGALRAHASVSEVAALAAMLGDLKARVESDPVGARADLRTSVEPRLRAAMRQAASRKLVWEQIAGGRELLARLRGVGEEIGPATTAACAKVIGVTAEQAALDEVAALAAWLNRLEQRSGDEKPDALEVGLRNWRKAAEALLAREQKKLAQVRQPVEARRELRGRLEALKAKARAYGLAEEQRFAGLAADAEKLLYTRPTDLVLSTAAVEAYERGLSRTRTVGQTRAAERGARR